MSDLSPAINSRLDSVSSAMDVMTQAARDGAADAREAAAKAFSSTSLFLSRMLYTSTYTISYGVIFPVALVARGIPTDNAAVRGLIEGAQAASRRADAMLRRDV